MVLLLNTTTKDQNPRPIAQTGGTPKIKLCRILLCVLCLWNTADAQQVLRWGADPSGGAPYVFTDPANPDRYIGYEKEMVDVLAQAMGRRAEFVPSDWETLVSALQRQSFDVIQ